MKQLSEEQLSFVCPMNFADMPESANGRFCDQCNKEVFDLSGCTLEEAIALQKKHGSICAFVRTTALVAGTAAAMSMTSCETVKSETPGCGTPSPGTCSPNLPSGVAGGLRAFNDLERMIGHDN